MQGSVDLFGAWIKAKGPAELHVFPDRPARLRQEGRRRRSLPGSAGGVAEAERLADQGVQSRADAGRAPAGLESARTRGTPRHVGDWLYVQMECLPGSLIGPGGPGAVRPDCSHHAGHPWNRGRRHARHPGEGRPEQRGRSGCRAGRQPVFQRASDNKIYRVDADDHITVLFDAGRVDDRNGERWRLPALAMDGRGRIFACRRAGPGKIGIAIVYPAGDAKFVADSYRGKTLFRAQRPHPGEERRDLFHRSRRWAGSPSCGLLRQAVRRGSPGHGRPRQSQRDSAQPRRKTLYVVDSRSEYVLAFDVKPDGTLGSRRNFLKLKGVRKNEQGVIDSGIDGMALDSQGNIYAISHDGVEVFNLKGEPLGVISVGTQATNLAFAGKDGKTLYITTHESLFKVHMLAERYRGRAK